MKHRRPKSGRTNFNPGVGVDHSLIHEVTDVHEYHNQKLKKTLQNHTHLSNFLTPSFTPFLGCDILYIIFATNTIKCGS
jgi:hypothetical protein